MLTGKWKRAGQRLTVTYQLSWSWVKRVGPKEEYKKALSMTKKDTLLYAGVEYRREPRLDKNALQDITLFVPAFAGGQNRK